MWIGSLGASQDRLLEISHSGRTTLDRLAGFRQEMGSAGPPVPATYIHEIPGSAPEKAALAVDHLMGLPDRLTALVGFNDMLAIGILKNLQSRSIWVLEEFSITGYDNIVFSN